MKIQNVWNPILKWLVKIIETVWIHALKRAQLKIVNLDFEI